jgi:transcriptional regulator with XRE-family HTH domain
MKRDRVKGKVRKSHTAKKAAESPDLSTSERRELFRQFRKYTGITLTAFGEICGLTNPMLSMFEADKRDLSDKAWARVFAAITQVVAQYEAKYKAEHAKLSGETTRIIVNNAVIEGERKMQVEVAVSAAVTDVWKVMLSWIGVWESASSAEAKNELLLLLKENIRNKIFPPINQLVTQRNYWKDVAQTESRVISELQTRLAESEQKRARAVAKAK